MALTSAFTGWDFASRRTSPLPLLALSGVGIEPTTSRCGGQRSYHRARPERQGHLYERVQQKIDSCAPPDFLPLCMIEDLLSNGKGLV